jgi:type 1 fimbria pilin
MAVFSVSNAWRGMMGIVLAAGSAGMDVRAATATSSEVLITGEIKVPPCVPKDDITKVIHMQPGQWGGADYSGEHSIGHVNLELTDCPNSGIPGLRMKLGAGNVVNSDIAIFDTSGQRKDGITLRLRQSGASALLSASSPVTVSPVGTGAERNVELTVYAMVTAWNDTLWGEYQASATLELYWD